VSYKDGHPLKCWTEAPDHQPLCIYAVRFDRVAFEDAMTRQLLANWRMPRTNAPSAVPKKCAAICSAENFAKIVVRSRIKEGPTVSDADRRAKERHAPNKGILQDAAAGIVQRVAQNLNFEGIFIFLLENSQNSHR
jgi:hypothetical protein